MKWGLPSNVPSVVLAPVVTAVVCGLLGLVGWALYLGFMAVYNTYGEDAAVYVSFGVPMFAGLSFITWCILEDR